MPVQGYQRNGAAIFLQFPGVNKFIRLIAESQEMNLVIP